MVTLNVCVHLEKLSFYLENSASSFQNIDHQLLIFFLLILSLINLKVWTFKVGSFLGKKFRNPRLDSSNLDIEWISERINCESNMYVFFVVKNYLYDILMQDILL